MMRQVEARPAKQRLPARLTLIVLRGLTPAAAELRAPAAGDDRTFTVDNLDRLTATNYQQTDRTESSHLDLVGNREWSVNRGGERFDYGAVDAANEYATISGRFRKHQRLCVSTGS
jgi:hypothetical protein